MCLQLVTSFVTSAWHGLNTFTTMEFYFLGRVSNPRNLKDIVSILEGI